MVKVWEWFPSFLGVGGESAFLHYFVFSSQQLLQVVWLTSIPLSGEAEVQRSLSNFSKFL